MTDEKKKPDEDEVGDEQLEDVAGGVLFANEAAGHIEGVADNIAAAPGKLDGMRSALSDANEALSDVQAAMRDGTAPTKPPTKG
jgi:hypothetical protein